MTLNLLPHLLPSLNLNLYHFVLAVSANLVVSSILLCLLQQSLRCLKVRGSWTG
ncbi:hypothetical protein L218DRAFT_959856 [Marasmius fiardii PR-910]|nr:hypothetical protein L218DRAFT_959856 [Marasmius fiardii PR-910]